MCLQYNLYNVYCKQRKLTVLLNEIEFTSIELPGLPHPLEFLISPCSPNISCSYL